MLGTYPPVPLSPFPFPLCTQPHSELASYLHSAVSTQATASTCAVLGDGARLRTARAVLGDGARPRSVLLA